MAKPEVRHAGLGRNPVVRLLGHGVRSLSSCALVSMGRKRHGTATPHLQTNTKARPGPRDHLVLRRNIKQRLWVILTSSISRRATAREVRPGRGHVRNSTYSSWVTALGLLPRRGKRGWYFRSIGTEVHVQIEFMPPLVTKHYHHNDNWSGKC